MPNPLHPSFVRLLLLYPHPLSDVFRLKVRNVVETCVSLYHVDKSMIVQHVWEGEEVLCVDENIFAIDLVSRVKGKAFLAACVHSGR